MAQCHPRTPTNAQARYNSCLRTQQLSLNLSAVSQGPGYRAWSAPHRIHLSSIMADLGDSFSRGQSAATSFNKVPRPGETDDNLEVRPGLPDCSLLHVQDSWIEFSGRLVISTITIFRFLTVCMSGHLCRVEQCSG